jgi:hypothetical protein
MVGWKGYHAEVFSHGAVSSRIDKYPRGERGGPSYVASACLMIAPANRFENEPKRAQQKKGQQLRSNRPDVIRNS